MKDRVIMSLHGVDEAHAEYIRMRNGAASRRIADYMGLPYVEDPTAADFVDPASYTVPAGTIDFQTAKELFGISSVYDFYGAAVAHPGQTDKSMLYPCVSLCRPDYYIPDMAAELLSEGLVLPGFSGFSREEILQAYPLYENDKYNLRVVTPNSSDGDGQFTVQNIAELQRILTGLPDQEIAERGLAVIADLDKPETFNVGYFYLGGARFNYVSSQKSIQRSAYSSALGHEVSQGQYGGAHLTVAKEGKGNLEDMPGLSENELYALRQGRRFLDIYTRHVNPMASRLSVDLVMGAGNKSVNGRRGKAREMLLGGTDITARFSGACPFFVLAAPLFKDERVTGVQGEMTLNYNPSVSLNAERGAVKFIDAPELRATARVNTVIKGRRVYSQR